MQLFCLAGISAQNFQHPHKSVTKAAHQYTVYEVTGRKRKLWSISMSAKNDWQITINERSLGDSPGDKSTQEYVTLQMSTSLAHGGLGSH